jgi:hypothetical protein
MERKRIVSPHDSPRTVGSKIEQIADTVNELINDISNLASVLAVLSETHNRCLRALGQDPSATWEAIKKERQEALLAEAAAAKVAEETPPLVVEK